MRLNRVNSAIDRNERNKLNENFDILERGYGKSAIDAQTAKTISEQAKQIADSIDGKAIQALQNSNDAIATSDDAMNLAESIQTQFNQVVIDGDSSVEAAQARVDADNTVYDTLKARLDTEKEQVTQHLASVDANALASKNAKKPLLIPSYDGQWQNCHPSVIDFKKYGMNEWNGYRYWMAATPYANSYDPIENPSIYVSNDKVSWSSIGTNPIDKPTTEQIADNYHMSDTELVYNPTTNKLECWYRLNKNLVYDALLRKTSSDGQTWTAREVVYGGSNANVLYMSPAVIIDDNKYKMWMVSNALSTSLEVLYTESTTGAVGTWSPLQKVNLIGAPKEGQILPWHVAVTNDSGKLVMLLNVFDSNNNATKNLMVGEGLDELNFENLRTILKSNPNSTAWDSALIYRACLNYTDGLWSVYYSAHNTNQVWGIGLLEGVTLDTLTDPDPRVSRYDLEYVRHMQVMDRVYLETLASWVKADELKLLIKDIAGGRIQLNNLGQFEFRNDSGSQYTGTVAKKMRVVHETGSPATFEIFHPGVIALGIALGELNSLSVQTESGEIYPIEASTLLLTPSSNMPAVAGALKYQDGKFQGYGNDNVYSNLNTYVSTVPTTATSNGTKGDYAADANYLYVCHATNQWMRIAKSTW